MTTRTIQTHKLIEKLVQAGLTQPQSEAIIDNVLETQQDFVTVTDLELALAAQTNRLIFSMIAIVGLAVAVIKVF